MNQHWDQQTQEVYDQLKHCITEPTTLSTFNPDLSILTEVQTDASKTGFGAVLIQYDENKLPHVIAFASCTLTTVERKYSVIEKEVLAISYAIQFWKVFLL